MDALVEPAPPPARAPDGSTTRQVRTRWVLGILLLLVGLWTIRAFLPALAWAAILAIATWRLYGRVRERHPPRGHDILWPTLFTGAVALLFLVPLAVAAIQIAKEARVVLGLIEEARRGGLPVPDWLPKLPLAGSAAAEWWRQNLADSAAASQLIERLNHGEMRQFTRSLGGQLVRRAVVFGFTILTLFFLYRDGLWLVGELRRVSAGLIGPHGERVGRQMAASIHGTVDGLVLVGLGEGFLIGIAYWLGGVPHPTLFGAATGIAAMVPFGAAALYGAAALTVLTQGSLFAAIGIVVFGTVVVFVADHAIRPALIGGATKLPFVWVLLGILGGVETFGLLGLFLGPALMAALHLLWREWTEGVAEEPGDPVPAEPLARPAVEAR